MIQQIVQELVDSINGAHAAIFMDGDGEKIAQCGTASIDIHLFGVWKEIQLDHIRDLTIKLGLGNVRAVLFSLDEGSAVIAPVSGTYCLLIFMSNLVDLRVAMAKLSHAVEALKKDIE